MRRPLFKPTLWKATVNYACTGAPVAQQTVYLHAESRTAAISKVRTYYRQQGVQVQLYVEKASALYLTEAISFARESNALQDHRHLSDYAQWALRYNPTDSLNAKEAISDSFAHAFNNALASANV